MPREEQVEDVEVARMFQLCSPWARTTELATEGRGGAGCVEAVAVQRLGEGKKLPSTRSHQSISENKSKYKSKQEETRETIS